MKSKGKNLNVWVVLLSIFLLFGPFLKVEALAIANFKIDTSYLNGSLNNSTIKDATGTISLNDRVTPGNANHDNFNTVTLNSGLGSTVVFTDINLKGGNANSAAVNSKNGGSIFFSSGEVIPSSGSRPEFDMTNWLDNNKYTIKTGSLTLQSGAGDSGDSILSGGIVQASFYNLEVDGDINLTSKNTKSDVKLWVNNYLKANAINIKHEIDYETGSNPLKPKIIANIEGDADKAFSLIGGLNIDANDVKTDQLFVNFTLNKAKGLEIGNIKVNLNTTETFSTTNPNSSMPESTIMVLLNTNTDVESNIKDIDLKIAKVNGKIDFKITGSGGTKNININSINLEARDANRHLLNPLDGNSNLVEAVITANTKITNNITVFSEINNIKLGGRYSRANLTLDGNTEIGGNVLVEALINPTLNLETDHNAISQLTVKGEAKINSGNLTVKTVSSTTNIGKKSSATAIFDNLNFASSINDVNIKVIGAGSVLTVNNTLTLAGGKNNNIIFQGNIVSYIQLGTKLAIGRDGFSSSGTILNLMGTGVINSFSELSFYMYDALGGDTILTVNARDSGSDIIDLGTLGATKYKFSLAGIGLNPGEEIVLISSLNGVIGGFASTDLTAANIIKSAGLYNDSDFSISWDNNGKLVLALKDTAVRDDTGVIGANTENLWFNGLDTDTNGMLSDSEWEDLFDNNGINPSNKYYQQLSPNAKQMYYTLVYKNASGDPIYQWTNDNGGAEFRNNLDYYTMNVLPTLVGGTITKDDLIVSMLNEMDPQVFVNSGAQVSGLVNKSFNQVLNNVSGNSDNLAYWQNIAAGGESEGYRVWAQTSMVWEKLNDNGTLKGYDSRFYGGYLGLDYQYDDFRIGAALGVGDSDIDWNNNTDMEAVSFMAKVYGEYTPDLWVFGLAVGGGTSDFETERYIALNKHTADYNVSMFAADAYAGYKFSLLSAELMPKIGISYLRSKQEGFTEKGFLSQKFNSLTSDSLLSFANVTLKVPLELNNGTILQPKVFVGLSHELADIDNKLGHKFPGSSIVLNSEANKKKRTSFEGGLGLESKFTNDLNLSLDYQTQLQSNYNSHAVSLGLEYKF